MGWLDKAQAAAKLAAAEAAKLSELAKTSLESSEFDSEKAKQNKEKLSQILSGAKDLANEGKRLTAEMIDNASQTESGQLIGQGIRESTAALAKLPGIGIAGDLTRARHGINPLVAKLEIDPANPLINLQLAESMTKVERDLKIGDAATSVVHPGMALAKMGVRNASKIGATETDPLKTALLKRAFSLSVQGLSNEKDTNEIRILLEAISRIYYLQGFYKSSIKVTLLNPKAIGTSSTLTFTRGRSLMMQNEIHEARSCAIQCLKKGNSLGNFLHAEISLLDEKVPLKTRIVQYDEWMNKVSSSDFEAYFGFVSSIASATEDVIESQIAKVSNIVNKVKGNA